jgi:Pyridoxamine 5'-phosphate oxidase
MKLSDEIRHFVASPVMIIVGTRDEANRPAIGRAVGARIDADHGIEVVLSSWQWPETIANLGANGQAAITFARPSDYVSYQVKGAARLRMAEEADHDLVRRYQANILALFDGLGVTDELVRPWLVERDPVVACLAVSEVYVQTPGPKAGTAAR